MKLALFLFFSAIASAATAGKVILINDIYDYLPRVEIREGNWENPESNDLVFSGSLVRGQEFKSRDEVMQCYRRSGDPSNPKSGFTNWRCNSRTISGEEYWSLY